MSTLRTQTTLCTFPSQAARAACPSSC